LHELGVKPSVIEHARKNYKIPLPHQLFGTLDADIQVCDLEEMNPEEQKEYLKLAKPEARKAFLNESP
jgi:hypothetical protein